jgi:hypothetical protein
MALWIKRVAAISVVLVLLAAIAIAIVFWPRAEVAPMLTVEFLGYTNRTRPYALFAITNHSKGSVTLDPQCLMMYGTALSKTGPSRATSIEPLKLRVTRLGPGEGFVDEIFAFPASPVPPPEGFVGGIFTSRIPVQWQFECYASRTSTWLEFRRSVELCYYKDFRRMEFPPRSKTWHTFKVGPVDCPP